MHATKYVLKDDVCHKNVKIGVLMLSPLDPRRPLDKEMSLYTQTQNENFTLYFFE